MMAPQILMEDDFRHGLDLTDRWAITRFPPRFSADDGIVSASDRGLYVKAAGTNSQTGEPAFSETATGEDDHVKWMVDTRHRSSNSVGRISTQFPVMSSRSACGCGAGRSAPPRIRSAVR